MTHDTGISASIIIPTYNRPHLLKKCLQSLKQQTFPAPGFEIVVVEDRMDHLAKNIVEDFSAGMEHPEVVYISQETGGPASARNKGVSIARGNILVFTDDDCEPEPEWLATLLHHMENTPTCAGVGGIVKPVNNLTMLGKFFEFRTPIAKPLEENGEIIYVVTANAAFRRDAWEKCGGFDESFRWPGGEDSDLGIRLRLQGYKLNFNESACVYHHFTSKFSGHLVTSFNYGRGRYRIWKQYFPGTVWQNEPTLAYPLRIPNQFKILKAYLHNRQNTKEAIWFWIINYLTNIAELAGKIFEWWKANKNGDRQGSHSAQED